MISSDTIRGFNDLIILQLLSVEDSYGYKLSKDIAALSGNLYLIRETTLYSAINRLQDRGCIRGYDGVETFGRSRTYFAITPAGREYLLEKQSEWQHIRKLLDTIVNYR